jgi:integrase
MSEVPAAGRLAVRSEASERSTRVDLPPAYAAFDPRQLAFEIALHLQKRKPTTTLREHWDWWRPLYLHHLASADTFRQRVEHYLVGPLGDRTEETLTTEAIEAVLNGLAGPPRKLASQTLNHIRAHGHRIIADLIRVSPPRWTSPNPFSAVIKREVNPVEPYIPSEEEIAKLILQNRPEIQPRFAMLLTLGPRYGELRGIKLEDFDATNRRLYLRRSGARETLKNGEQRSMPLPDWLVPLLNQAAERSRAIGSEWLFPGKGGQQLTKNSKPGQLLRRALVRADIVEGYEHWCAKRGCDHSTVARTRDPLRCPVHDRILRVSGIPRKLRIHDLRHIAITQMQELGVHPGVVRRVVGHGRKKRGAASTTDRYTHLSERTVRAEINKVQWRGLEPGATVSPRQ